MGTKHISDLITSPDSLKLGRINVIEAQVSAGKTYFALNVIPQWATNPECILYLINTTNGESRMLKQMKSDNRFIYAFFGYNTPYALREFKNKPVVMTYSGFGSEFLKGSAEFRWWDYGAFEKEYFWNMTEHIPRLDHAFCAFTYEAFLCASTEKSIYVRFPAYGVKCLCLVGFYSIIIL